MFNLGCNTSPFFLHFYTERSTPQGLHKRRWPRLILVSPPCLQFGWCWKLPLRAFCVPQSFYFSAWKDHLQGFLFRAVTGTFSHLRLRLEELQNPLPMQPNQMGDRKLWHLTVQINAASIVWNLKTRHFSGQFLRNFRGLDGFFFIDDGRLGPGCPNFRCRRRRNRRPPLWLA